MRRIISFLKPVNMFPNRTSSQLDNDNIQGPTECKNSEETYLMCRILL